MTVEPAPPGPGLRSLALNGSPSHPSRSRLLAELVLAEIGGGDLVDLADLDPGALLAFRPDAAVAELRDRVAAAQILVVATPVYRATYTALTKTIFDLLPQGALAGTVAIPIATGYAADHRLAIDHGLRPLIASLGGWTTPTGIYATKADISDDGVVVESVRSAVVAAAAEARTLAHALATTST